MALTRQDYEDAAKLLNCEVEAVMAVATVESNGKGFDPEGFPLTLFEGHWFYKLTNGKYAKDYPTICYPTWTKQFYGKTWVEEKARLATAMKLDRNAAMQSASWGMFQLMGFNYKVCGFDNVQQFVNAMCNGEKGQLQAFAKYVLGNKLDGALRRKDWAAFAKGYNGPGYAANKYDTKMATTYNALKKSS